jgi:hypothetical protein
MGASVGVFTGSFVGDSTGISIGEATGASVGGSMGASVGNSAGAPAVGDSTGVSEVGDYVEEIGLDVGSIGLVVGLTVGKLMRDSRRRRFRKSASSSLSPKTLSRTEDRFFSSVPSGLSSLLRHTRLVDSTPSTQENLLLCSDKRRKQDKRREQHISSQETNETLEYNHRF